MMLNKEIESQIEALYPLKIKELQKTSFGLLINNNYILKPTELSSERLLFINTLINHLVENGFENCHPFTETKEGIPYAQLEGRNHVLMPHHSEPCFSFDDREELKVAAGLMAKLHLAGLGFTREKAAGKMEKYNLPFTVKCSLGTTPELFRKHCMELKKFKRMATGSVDDFDLVFGKIAGDYCLLAESLVSALVNSSYSEMVEEAEASGCICHKNFSGHNLVKAFPYPILGNFDEAAIDLPVYDIAILLRRRLRKCNWDCNEAYVILDTYSKIRVLSQKELELLKILLQFPNKLWKVANKYYNSKRFRYEKTALSKIEEIIAERAPLEAIIKAI